MDDTQTLEKHAETLAQRQLDAYNARNLNDFLACFSEDICAIALPEDRILYKSKLEMRTIFAKLFGENPQLHCRIVKRMVVGCYAIDQEEITGHARPGLVKAVAIYEIKDRLISRIWFLNA